MASDLTGVLSTGDMQEAWLEAQVAGVAQVAPDGQIQAILNQPSTPVTPEELLVMVRSLHALEFDCACASDRRAAAQPGFAAAALLLGRMGLQVAYGPGGPGVEGKS